MKRYFVNNDELYEDILDFKRTNIISEQLHMSFWNMCNNIINRPRFVRYTEEWKEDMITTAYIKCLKVVKKFKLSKKMPFSYFTTVITNCFIDHVKSENKQKQIKDKILDKHNIKKIY